MKPPQRVRSTNNIRLIKNPDDIQNITIDPETPRISQAIHNLGMSCEDLSILYTIDIVLNPNMRINMPKNLPPRIFFSLAISTIKRESCCPLTMYLKREIVI